MSTDKNSPYDISRDGNYVLNLKKFLQFQKAIFVAKEVVGVSERLTISNLDAKKLNGYLKIRASSAFILHDKRMSSFQRLINLSDSFSVFSYTGDEVEIELRVNGVFVKMS